MTLSEIIARIASINERLDAIERMLEGENTNLTNADGTPATLEQLESEYDSLCSELEELSAKKTEAEANEQRAQSRAQRRAAVAAQRGTPGAPAVHTQRRASESFVKEKRTRITGAETRSVLISSGMLATPTGAQSGVNEGFNRVSSIVDQVEVEDLTGMSEYLIPFVKELPEAEETPEGEKAAESDPDFRIAKIRATNISVLSYLSREVAKKSPAEYEQAVRNCALKALKKKAAGIIVHGSGDDVYGIYGAKDSKNESICDTLDMSAGIGADTLRKIVFGYGGEENVMGGCRLYLSKKDLVAFGDVRGKNELKAIYKITPNGENPNTGLIEDGGLVVPYTICSGITSYSEATATVEGVNTMIYGDPMKFTLGLFGDYEVRVSEDYKFGERLLSVMGEVTLGGNVNSDKGFLIIRKKTA